MLKKIALVTIGVVAGAYVAYNRMCWRILDRALKKIEANEPEST